MSDKIGKYIILLFPIVGIATLFMGIRELLKIRTAEKCIAMVVDEVFEESTNSDGDRTVSRYPIYEVEMPDGSKQIKRSKTSGGKRLGECTNVYIDERGKMLEVRSGIFLMIFGSIFLVVGLFATISIWRQY